MVAPVAWGPASESTWMPLFKLASAVFSLSLASLIFWYLRQPKSANQVRTTMLSDTVYELCHDEKTVTSELLQDPSQSPTKLFQKLYHDRKTKSHKSDSDESLDKGENELRKVLQCGNWGSSQPSDLFLKVINRPILSCFFPKGHT